jgi:hypothetical protein
MDVNTKFRLALLSKWPTLLDASREICIDNSSLSLLVRNRRALTASQRRKLLKYFSAYQIRKMFPRKVEGRIQGAKINAE